MTRNYLLLFCDAVVSGLLLIMATGFSAIAGVVTGALLLLVWLPYPKKSLRRPRNNRENRELERMRRQTRDAFLDPGSLENRHWYR